MAKEIQMKNFLLSLFGIVALSLTLLPIQSQAASGGASGGHSFLVGLSFMQLSQTTEGPNLGTTDSTSTILNGKIGYILSDGLYFGGIYDSRTDTTNGAKNERTGYGASIGYHNMGWFIDGSYFISSTYKLSGGVELSAGSGFGADVGKNFDLTSNIYLGLQISYRSFTYTKAAGVSATNKIKSELTPMLNLGVMF